MLGNKNVYFLHLIEKNFIFCSKIHDLVPQQRGGSEVNANPLPLALFVLAKVELVQLAGPVLYIGFIFAGIHQEVHAEELLAEIAPIKFNIQDGLI
jgi:hypothetical protein